MEKHKEMKDFLTELDLNQDVLDSLFRQLSKSDKTLDNWKKRSETQWKEFYGLAGVDIFNYLHPKCIFN